MTPSLILVIDQAIRLLVVVLVAVAKEQRVVARLAACVVRAQANGVKAKDNTVAKANVKRVIASAIFWLIR